MNPRDHDPSFTVDRREFLATASAAALLAAAAPGIRAEPQRPRTRPDKPRNLIFLVADGMSTGTLQIANIHANRTLGRNLHMWELLSEPSVHTSLVTTECANSLVTDSAAACSAWGCGRRVNRGALCHTPEGLDPIPLFARAHEHAGKAIGLVTTTFIQDATPAGFVVNAPKRSMYSAIAQQYASRPIDIIVGGGAREHIEAPGEQLSRTRRDFLGYIDRPGRHAGLLADWHMDYEIDRGDDQPSLAEMARASIFHLANTHESFCIMIEGARIDHAAHANDAAALVHDMLAFDDAVRVATDYAKQDPETLLIITTDHANANPGVARYAPYERYLANLAGAKHSFDWVFTEINKIPRASRSADAMGDLLQQALNVELTATERSMIARLLDNQPIDAFVESNDASSLFGAIAANHFGVAFNSPNHTSDPVISLAMGPGAERLPRLSHLVDTHDMLTDLFDLPPAF